MPSPTQKQEAALEIGGRSELSTPPVHQSEWTVTRCPGYFIGSCPCANQCWAGVRNEVRTGHESSPVLTRKTAECHLQ